MLQFHWTAHTSADVNVLDPNRTTGYFMPDKSSPLPLSHAESFLNALFPPYFVFFFFLTSSLSSRSSALLFSLSDPILPFFLWSNLS
jgi:hypothetical protein